MIVVISNALTNRALTRQPLPEHDAPSQRWTRHRRTRTTTTSLVQRQVRTAIVARLVPLQGHPPKHTSARTDLVHSAIRYSLRHRWVDIWTSSYAIRDRSCLMAYTMLTRSRSYEAQSLDDTRGLRLGTRKSISMVSRDQRAHQSQSSLDWSPRVKQCQWRAVTMVCEYLD